MIPDRGGSLSLKWRRIPAAAAVAFSWLCRVAVSTPLVDCRENARLQLYFLQDLSWSYEKDMPYLRSLFPQLLTELSERYPESEFGLGSFVDKPITPFGYPSDWCFKHEASLTTDQTSIIQKVNLMDQEFGYDEPESQLDAMSFALESGLVKWSTETYEDDGRPVVRVLAMSTDAHYHVAGDGWNLPPHDSSKPFDSNSTCTSMDYPSVDQISESLIKHDVNVLFLIADGMENVYVDLLKDLKVGGSVQTLRSDSADIIERMYAGIGDILCPAIEPVPPSTQEAETTAAESTTVPGEGTDSSTSSTGSGGSSSHTGSVTSEETTAAESTTISMPIGTATNSEFDVTETAAPISGEETVHEATLSAGWTSEEATKSEEEGPAIPPIWTEASETTRGAATAVEDDGTSAEATTTEEIEQTTRQKPEDGTGGTARPIIDIEEEGGVPVGAIVGASAGVAAAGAAAAVVGFKFMGGSGAVNMSAPADFGNLDAQTYLPDKEQAVDIGGSFFE